MVQAPEARVVHETIAAPANEVYAFARNMENLPRWASGLASGIQQVDGEWLAQSPMGRVKVTMAPFNDLGILDHDVTPPDGVTVHNAFRVTPAGDASVLAFVVVRRAGMSSRDFRNDAASVARDLRTLKAILEGRPAP